ncbi:MAG: peptidylprolyl isomerase [Thermoleophilaceae bacterium]
MLRYLTLPVMLLALGVAACGDDDDSDDGGDSGGATPAETQVQTQAQEPAPEREGGCVEVSQPEPKPDGGEEPPTEELSGETEVTFKTNCGSFTVTMDPEVGGLSAASFVQLAESGFYEDTFFHRIAPGFVIQGGDPTGTGTGGPGYTTRDAPPSDAQYPKYTVAMAKGGEEKPGTSGSQFFVMTGDSGLPPQYAIVGEVTGGTKVIDRIGKFGDATELPTRIVVLEKASVEGG